MATYEITVSTADGEYPQVLGIRRLGCIRGLWTRFKRWARYRHRSGAPVASCGNADMVDLQTVDIVMDVRCEKLRQEILSQLASSSDPNNVRLVFCLPTGRRSTPTKAVEV